VQIDKLQLRLPGLGREEARRVGAEVAQRLSESLPKSGKKERLGALTMRVKLPRGTRRDQIANLAARSILERLR
jgi:GGDEF domain-containing protein